MHVPRGTYYCTVLVGDFICLTTESSQLGASRRELLDREE